MPGLSSLQARVPYLLRILLIAAGYFVLARISLFLSFQSSNASPVWPPSGFAFAMILLFGYRIAPGILIGAFAANFVVFQADHNADLSTALWVSFIISIGNTGEAITGNYLLKKIIPGVGDSNYFRKVSHIFYFFLVTIVMSLVSSVIGTTAIVLGKFISAAQQYTAWLTWWLGDVSGILLVTPFILIWIFFFRSQDKFSFNRNKVIEIAALFGIVISASGIVFNNWISGLFIFNWAYWIIPVIVWAATRFRQHITITAIVICSVIAIWGTINGYGPFSNPLQRSSSDISLNQSLLITQAFISIIVISMLTLNASIISQKQTEDALREMGNQLEKRVNERTGELEERSRLIETLFDSVEDLMAVFDRQGNYLSVNRKVEEVYQMKRDEMIGKNVLKLFPAVKESGMYDNLQKALAGETIHQFAYRSAISNRWFENFYIPLKNNKQEIHGALVIGHDNTVVMEASEKIKQSEEQSRLSEAKFKGLLENAPDAMVIVNNEGIIELVNAQTETLFGFEKNELLGQKVELLIPGRFHPAHSAHRKNYFQNPKFRGMGVGLNLYGKKKDGSEFPVEISLSPLETAEGVLISASIRDVTERKKAEEKIKAINAKLTEAQRIAHVGNWEWDIPNNRISWSDELFRVFGLAPQEFEASYESYLRYIHPDERENVNKIVQEAYTSFQPFDFYHRVVRPNGEIRVLHGRGEVFVNDKREPVSMAGTAQDVTEIKQAEEEIKQMADELIRYNRQLEQTNKELESFTFVASHDLQEPLRKIRTFLNLIADKEMAVLSDTSKNYLNRTINSARQMQQLIIDLLAYSRTTGSEEHFQKTDLNDILQKVKADLKEVIEEKKASIEATGLPELNVIPFQFEQLFTNMIGNSLKFSKPDVPPHITIRSEIVDGKIPGHMNGDPGKKYYSLSISDNGIGFEAKYSEKVFDLFKRLHSLSEYSGTGIGLSICKKIIENHKGFIVANGVPGAGATFNIYLPQ